MIQRKQTIFLLISILEMVFNAYIPLGHVSPATLGDDIVISVVGTSSHQAGFQLFGGGTIALFPFNILVIVLELVAIFRFKNRKSQIKLCNWSMIALVLWYVAFGLLYLTLISPMGEYHLKGINLFAPFIALVWTYFAKRAIEHDERLVKAADRIR